MLSEETYRVFTLSVQHPVERILHPPEREKGHRRRDADVDAHVARFHSVLEFPCRLAAGCENGVPVAVAAGIYYLYRFIEVLRPHHTGYRPEDFFPAYCHVRRNALEDARAEETRVRVVAVDFRFPAVEDKFGFFLDAFPRDIGGFADIVRLSARLHFSRPQINNAIFAGQLIRIKIKLVTDHSRGRNNVGACKFKTISYKRMITKYFKFEPQFIHSGLDIDLNILYDYPDAVGTDRLCNAIAGKSKYGSPLIIIDFGTAITFDCINKNGDYLGGIICAGLETTSEILYKKAAKLPKIDLKFPKGIIGKNPEESIQSGIMYGAVEMVDGLIKKIRNYHYILYSLK